MTTTRVRDDATATSTSSELTGTASLTRFVLRRDWLRILIWIAAIVVLVVATVVSLRGLYPTRADLLVAAKASEGNAAAIAFNGPAQALDTLGGQVAFQTGAFGLVVVGLMSLMMIGRLTRGEEEAGRLELLRSLPIGPHAPTAAALITVAGMDVIVGVLVTLTLLSQNLPAAGSVAFGMSFTLVGLLFAAVAMVAAQVSANTRVAYGIAGGVLGAAFVLRAVGDIGDGTISWLSPIGWAQKTRPFAGEQWWPFLVIVAFTAALVLVAGVLSRRRDLGGGLAAPRRGRAHATPGLGRPVGLALRLQRGALVGWSVGLLLTGVAYGSIADSVNDFVKDNKTLTDLIAARGGANLADAYLAMSFRILAIAAAGFAIQSALRIRSEETGLHAEQILATAVSRTRWAASHLTMAFGGTVIVLAVTGLSVGVSDAAVTGDVDVVTKSLGAALAYAPAIWLLAALTVALVGLAPRAVGLSWGLLAVCFVIGMFGQLLELPQWVSDVSPFQHVPQLPAADLTLAPLLVLTAIAAVLTVAGLVGLRRRDIG
ncbi:MAG: ABC transporter permease [Acidimicrobiia bacterium]